MKKTLLLALLISFVSINITLAQKGDELKILFIGNSYTGVNDLPSKLKLLSESMGKSVNIQSLTPGGAQFITHVQNSQTYTMINSEQWDYVILQAQSQEPAFPPAEVASDTYPYAAILCDSIKAANPCTEIVFYMTWGRKNGDAMNAAYYPTIATYEGMQMRLRQSYLEMAQDNDATCAPVGAAWKWVRDNYSSIELYSADESHPSIYGTYLAACVFYSTIFVESPVGSTYFPTNISQGDGTILQTAAQNIVIDSLDNWRIHANLPDAEFNHTINQNKVEFASVNQDNNIVDFEWHFGDGIISNDVNPIHTYQFTGNFSVMLVANTNCNSDTSYQDITILSLVGINNLDAETLSIFPNPFQNTLVFNIDENVSNNIQILNIDGKVIETIITDKNRIEVSTEHLLSGIYFVQILVNDNIIRRKIIKI